VSTLLQGLAPTRATLANGAVVLAQQTVTHSAVTMLVAVRAGSAHDPADRLGLAHFVSKVIDRGTDARSGDAIAEALDGRGVTLNSSVGRHLLTLGCTCLAEDFDDIIGLVADIVRRPTFAQTEVDTRRGEIVTAIRQDEDSPATMAVDGLMGLLYPDGHPYGRPTKGVVATVEATTRADLAAYHQARFSPEHLIVVIVGDVSAPRGIAAAERVFGDWHTPGSAPLVLPPLGPAAGRRRQVIPMMNKAQTDVAYGFVTVTRRDPDYYALTLMNNVLGQYGLGGRLGDSIRERQGMAYYAFSSFDGNVAEGPLVIRAGVAPENVDRTVASIDEEVRTMVREGVTAAELADAKRYLIGSMPRNLETNSGIASFLHTAEFYGLGLDHDQRLPALLDVVTLEHVHAATRRILDPDRAALVIAGPYDPATHLDAPSPR
jgi:zinc protease